MAKKTGKNLVIVESPAKAKTINKYLGDNYIVKASMGHVRDMPRSGLQVDLETFEPNYEVSPDKTKVITELKKLAKDAPEIFLATDLDREGEAIAWHLKEALGIPDAQVKRVIFNAITKSEIQKAFASPHPINQNRVNAQQARRVLDRLVGYELSPILWRKVARGLSAGRVQSVAVRLVVEREREIEAFVPDEYWRIGAVFTANGAAAPKLASEWSTFVAGEPAKAEKERFLAERDAFTAELTEFAGKKFEPSDVRQARAAAEALGYVVEREDVGKDESAKGPEKRPTKLVGRLGAGPTFVVDSVEKKRTTSRPPGPFITSTLQQGAASRLGMGAQKAMRTAQTLYEQGYITYMRTDSTHLSGEALTMVRGFIPKQFGPRYLPDKPNFYASSNKGAQEAHEAIRPTDVAFSPADAKAKLGSDEFRLYQLIWNRFVACQMTNAEFDQTTAYIGAATKAGKATFKANGRKLVFDGFMKVAGVSSDDQLLPDLVEAKPVFPIDLSPSQHFTQPPPRYTEASLVKKLEEEGIGRPSTYASIIQTIQDREYVTQVDRRFFATQLGCVVTDKLVQAFPEIMNVRFTAGMEGKLDEVEEASVDWVKLLRDFYGPFHLSVEGSLEKIEHAGGAKSPFKCPKCGKGMLYRISKSGFFLACEDRECNTTQPVDFAGKPTLREVSEFKCPVCGREMIKRSGRFGDFLGCSGYSVKNEKGEPSCSVVINLDADGKPLPPKPKPITTSIPCGTCGSPLYLRGGKRGPWLGCSKYPKCRGRGSMEKLSPQDRAQVDALIPLLAEGSEAAAAMAAKVIADNPSLAPAGGPARSGPIVTDIDCDVCGKHMICRKGKRGYFLGCSGYPKCKNTGEVPAKLVEELGLGEARPSGESAAKIEPEDTDDGLEESAA
jgi:DNA topoisomerase-1